MAIGDDAALAGMALVPGSALANTIDTELNQSRDYTANGPARWKPGVTVPVTKGGTGATTAPAARTALGLGNASTREDIFFVKNDSAPTNTIGLQWQGNRLQIHIDGTFQGTIAITDDLRSILTPLIARIEALESRSP